MAVVDSDYNFIYINVGAYGKDCDSAVLKNTAFSHKMIINHFKLATTCHYLTLTLSYIICIRRQSISTTSAPTAIL